MIHFCVTKVAIIAVFIIQTPFNTRSTSVVVFVAHPVAAVVRARKSKPGRIVGIFGYWEILSVETEVIATLGPS